MNSYLRFNFKFNLKIDVNVDLCLFVGSFFEVGVEVEAKIWLARRRKIHPIRIYESFINSIVKYGVVKVKNQCTKVRKKI